MFKHLWNVLSRLTFSTNYNSIFISIQMQHLHLLLCFEGVRSGDRIVCNMWTTKQKQIKMQSCILMIHADSRDYLRKIRETTAKKRDIKALLLEPCLGSATCIYLWTVIVIQQSPMTSSKSSFHKLTSSWFYYFCYCGLYLLFVVFFRCLCKGTSRQLVF